MVVASALLFTFLAFSSCPSLTSATLLQNNVKQLFKDYFEWKLDRWALDFNFEGFSRNPDVVDDLSEESFSQQAESCRQFSDRAENILIQDNQELDVRTRRYVKIVMREAQECYEGAEFKPEYLVNINFLGGVQTQIPLLFKQKNALMFDTLEDYRNAIELLRKIPRLLDQVKTLLLKGIEAGITLNQASLVRTTAQWDNLLNIRAIEDSDFYAPFRNLSREGLAIQQEAERVIKEDVLPAYHTLKNFIFRTYTSHLRPLPGIYSLPNGKKFYEALLEFHTTVRGLSAEEIHNIGLVEVDRTKQELMAIVTGELGFANSTFKEFSAVLKSSRSQEFQSSSEIVDYFQDAVASVEPQLISLFKEPVLSADVYDLSVQKVPPGGGGMAYYLFPSVDGRRLGTLYVNANQLNNLRKYEVASLTLHEGNPGHHLQANYILRSRLPNFLKYRVNAKFGEPAYPPSYNGFVEGWGLYAEFLGLETGLYDDPVKKIGYYSMSLLRASRLVVDTGIHALGWTKQEAIDYLIENTAMSVAAVEEEIDRYITMPGQATSYKIGELKIRQLREKKEAEPDFDIREFHEHILNCLGPLDWLEECVNEEESLVTPTLKNRKRFEEARPRFISASNALSASVTVSISITLLVWINFNM